MTERWLLHKDTFQMPTKYRKYTDLSKITEYMMCLKGRAIVSLTIALR